MAAHKQKRLAFLAKHPKCCFCGGEKPSQEVDHIPSRAIFENRQWPEGYEFPACISCNRATRYDEQIVAMLSRLYPDPATDSGRKEQEKAIQAVHQYHPDIFEEMSPSSNDIRRALKRYGIEKPQNTTYKEMNLLKLGPKTNLAVINFLRKLFLALYYMNTGRALPKNGGMRIEWLSNMQFSHQSIPDDFFKHINGFPELKRSSKSLDNQFFYRYTITSDMKSAAFMCFFRESFMAICLISDDKKEMSVERAEIYGPFD